MFYACRERFDVDDGERWVEFLGWLGRDDLRRVVTLDSMLCPSLIPMESDEAWGFALCEQHMPDVFTDLDFVLRQAASFPRHMVLAAAREPSEGDVSGFSHPDFEFAGFDLFDTACIASALLNCGGSPEVFSATELSEKTGLIMSRDRAFEIRDRMLELNPYEPHADCHVWALWRRTVRPRAEPVR